MFRQATSEDLPALLDLEREANLAALGHVFPPDRYPYPDSDMLARWALMLEEPGAEVVVRNAPVGRDGRRGLDVLAAYDSTTLRQLAVRPDRWGTGLASAVMETVLHAMDQRGTTVAQLWCLEENHRARRVYEHLGWRATADRESTPWPPHPVTMRYTRLIPQSER